MSEIIADEKIKSAVRKAYGGIARRFVEEPAPTRSASCCGSTEAADEKLAAESASCCGPGEAAADCSSAASSLYADEELADLPDTVTDAALGCGNPTAIAELRPGEVVLDLGSGGGIDCFLAAKKVGPEGKVIGLDMTPDMIKLARNNAKKVGAANVEFRYGEMEEIPLPDQSVDVIISNCVINLSPDKDAVFSEAYRVLRPGGRMSVSDIVTNGDLSQSIKSQLDAWAGCVAGALDESVYLDKIRAAGFDRVELASRTAAWPTQVSDLGAQVVALADQGQGRLAQGEEAKALLEKMKVSLEDLAHRVASIKVTAYKSA